MLTVLQAQMAILREVETLESERVPLALLAGRRLSESFRATRALPPWDNSAMDGYAVRAADIQSVPMILPVVDEIAAGDGREIALPGGCAMRIFTGAPMPDGADAVVLQEDTQRVSSGVEIQERPNPKQHVRQEGSDVSCGAAILPTGRTLTPGDLSFLASQGCTELSVVRRPLVTVLATGSELVAPDMNDLSRGQIVDGNTPALIAAVEASGAIARGAPSVCDAFEATKSAIHEASSRSDVLITTGGVSVGAYDHVRTAFEHLSGDDFGFWKVAIKPGKPVVFARIGRCFCFGLPGNPVSALVTFEIFVKPALRRMMGELDVYPQSMSVRLEAGLSAGGRRQEYRRCKLQRTPHGYVAIPARTQSSGALSSIAGQDGLMVIPPSTAAKRAGDYVEVIPLARLDSILVDDRSKLDYGHDLSEDLSDR